MHAAALRLELHIPYAQSLKEKRRVVKNLSAALMRKFPVAVAEVDHQDTWQRLGLGVAAVSAQASQLDRILHAVESYVDELQEVDLVGVRVTYCEEPS